jgi:hypothetical protein
LQHLLMPRLMLHYLRGRNGSALPSFLGCPEFRYRSKGRLNRSCNFPQFLQTFKYKTNKQTNEQTNKQPK